MFAMFVSLCSRCLEMLRSWKFATARELIAMQMRFPGDQTWIEEDILFVYIYTATKCGRKHCGGVYCKSIR